MPWDCFLIRRCLSRYLDGELSDRSAARIERHLARCPSCQAELDAYHRTAQFVSRHDRVHPPAGCWERITRQLRCRGVPGFGEPSGPRMTGEGSSGPRRRGEQPAPPRRGWRAAAAAALVLLLAAFLGLPGTDRTLAPPGALAHGVDLSSLADDMREDCLGEMSLFGQRYRIHPIQADRAGEACPSGKRPPVELPAGYLLDRAMGLQTDCCPGLLLEYRRGDSVVIVLQISSHHPLEWKGVSHESRRIGTEVYQVHEEQGLRILVRSKGPINLLVAGDPGPEVLSEIASFLILRAETGLEARGPAPSN